MHWCKWREVKIDWIEWKANGTKWRYRIRNSCVYLQHPKINDSEINFPSSNRRCFRPLEFRKNKKYIYKASEELGEVPALKGVMQALLIPYQKRKYSEAHEKEEGSTSKGSSKIFNSTKPYNRFSRKGSSKVSNVMIHFNRFTPKRSSKVSNVMKSFTCQKLL